MLKKILSFFLVLNLMLLALGVNQPALAKTTGELNVATYNVESPRICQDQPLSETVPEIVAQNIEKLRGPDLWALSEVPARNALDIYTAAAQKPGTQFKSILGTKGGCDDKLAIIYNAERMMKIGNERELINQVGGDRPPLVAQFKIIDDGTEFLAVANHFNRGSSNTRNRQAKNLRDWIERQDLPVAVAVSRLRREQFPSVGDRHKLDGQFFAPFCLLIGLTPITSQRCGKFFFLPPPLQVIGKSLGRRRLDGEGDGRSSHFLRLINCQTGVDFERYELFL